MLELYPEDAARIRFGQRVEAEMQSLPGETFEGRVAFIDPTVSQDDRTVGVRVEFLNDDGRLRPGDYATAQVYLPIGKQGEVYDADLAGRWISPMHPQIIRDEPGSCPICGMDLVPTSRYGYSDQPVEQPAVDLCSPVRCSDGRNQQCCLRGDEAGTIRDSPRDARSNSQESSRHPGGPAGRRPSRHSRQFPDRLADAVGRQAKPDRSDAGYCEGSGIRGQGSAAGQVESVVKSRSDWRRGG